MSLCCFLVELPAAPLAFSPVIVFNRCWLVAASKVACTWCSFRPSCCSHSLSKHLWLRLPFCSLAILLDWFLILCYCFLTRLPFLWRWLIRIVIFSSFIFYLSLSLGIKYFSLLDENLFAYFLVLGYCWGIELSTAGGALDSLPCIVIAILIFFIIFRVFGRHWAFLKSCFCWPVIGITTIVVVRIKVILIWSLGSSLLRHNLISS